MDIHTSLPKAIKVEDYHQFNEIENTLKIINKSIKVREIGLLAGQYVGIVYFNHQDEAFDALKKEIKDRIKHENTELDAEYV